VLNLSENDNYNPNLALDLTRFRKDFSVCALAKIFA